MEPTIRLSPEQNEHNHLGLRWDWKKDVFVCMGTKNEAGCGAELVIPELSECMLLTAVSE